MQTPKRQITTQPLRSTNMMKLKKKTLGGASATSAQAKQVAKVTAPREDAEAPVKKKLKVKPVRAAATEDGSVPESSYDVRLYAINLQKWDEKKRCCILGVNNGMLFFEHKRPRSPKMMQRAVPLEKIIQYGGSTDGGWVHLMTRQQIDRFTAVGITRKGSQVVFDLGDGVTTSVNVDADYEAVGIAD